jgi:magnesium transporter
MRRLYVSHNGEFEDNPDIAGIATDLRDLTRTTWLDIRRDPNAEDIAILREVFGFHPLALEDALHVRHPAKVDIFGRNMSLIDGDAGAKSTDLDDDGTPKLCGDHYFLIVYTAHWDAERRRTSLQPLSIFVGRNYIVTLHRGVLDDIEDTVRRWRAPDGPLGDSTGALLHALLDTVVDGYFPVLDRIADQLQRLEDAIFEDFDEGLIREIFRLKKDSLRIRRALAPMRDILNTLLRRDVPVFDSADLVYFRDVYEHVIRHIESVDIDRDLLTGVLDSFLSMQSNRLNQVVKVLTVGSIVLMSVTLIAGIYGMNFEHMPELRWTYGYAWALGLMVAIAIGLVALFRRMKWL